MTRRVLILGATSAIAVEVCRNFASEHARLFLVGRDKVKLAAAANDLRARGAEAVEIFVADLGDCCSHPAILAQASTVWGGLDSALVAYGVLPDQQACERNPAALQSAMQTNCHSVLNLLEQLSNIFEAQRRGVLAMIGSVAGDRIRRSNYVYGTAKAAVASFCSGLRLRLTPAGVDVVLVKPGWVDTPMTAHLAKNFLYASPQPVGRAIYNVMLRPRSVVYLPWFWRWIMLVVRMIPEPVFARLNL